MTPPPPGRDQRNLARAGLTDQVHPHVQTSAEAAREFAHPVELVFVDGAHDYASVLQDFALWFPKVVDGGVMAFHDTVGYAGPRRVVRDHLYRSPRFRRVRFADALTYAEKTHRATARERCANEVRWWMHQVYAGAFFVATRPRVKALLKRLRRRAPARTTAPRI